MAANHEQTTLVDIQAVAARLDTSVRWVRRARWPAREIPFIKLGHFVRFDPHEIDAWLEASRVPTGTQRLDDERRRFRPRHAGGRGVAGAP